jgi:hypothetical protein
MRPYCLIVDDFFPNFEAVRKMVCELEYTEQANPDDGLQYPSSHVFNDPELSEAIGNRLGAILGRRKANIRLLVARMSKAGAPCPEQAHTDEAIINPPPLYTAVIYCNTLEQCRGGTSLLAHAETGRHVGIGEQEKRDQNDASKWNMVMQCPMYPNRAAIFPSPIIHRSEPVGGFGSDATDARVVIVALFDLE